MKQIIQSYKTGEMEIVNVPIPPCGDGGMLVQTSNSLISAGTEKMLIDIARKSMIGKAKARPDLVKQVLAKIKKEGLIPTVQKVMTKLEVPIPLGYSCAGTVVVAGRNIKGIQAGDRVACAGAGYANHAEVNYVPKNLVVKIPNNVTDEQASFTTVATIALQGVRQCNPTMGEKIAVIGVGLIGLITVQLLKANGCSVLAIDVDQDKLDLAKKLGADTIAVSQNTISVAETFSNGNGVDGVIITAASKSNKIINDAGEISRMKGRVIMVGMTPMDIPRDIYYKKELDFRLSMSYGPGRYDPDYEQGGQDYPLPYVRWTEQRNMETILNLVAQGRLDIDSLISHRFNFENVFDAYKVINGETNEQYMGVILKYDTTQIHGSHVAIQKSDKKGDGSVSIGFIGAGNFAQSVLFPNITKLDCDLHTLVESNTVNSAVVTKKYKVQNISSNIDEMLQNDEINTVFITTPHQMHSYQVTKALNVGKHVFVEKPLAISEDELSLVKSAYEKSNQQLMVGYNRRFSPHARKIRERLNEITTPLVMNYIVNAGAIPMDHWIQNPKLGGGRIIGEVCHFIDFMQYITASLITSVYASAIRTDNKNYSNNDSIQITLEFKNGSIGNISYHALGDSSLPKEYFEVSAGGLTAKLYDFKRTDLVSGGKSERLKTRSQDKGFLTEYSEFLKSVKGEMASLIEFESLFNTTIFRILIQKKYYRIKTSNTYNANNDIHLSLPALKSVDRNSICIFGKSINPSSLNWNSSENSKLWQYHLHYFDYLDCFDYNQGLKLIHNWIDNNPIGQGAGWEPYPISLRVVNWIKFFSRHQIEPNDQIVHNLFVQKNVLFKYRELHLCANHFFKNIVALLYLSALFQDNKLFKWSINNLKKQIVEQQYDGLHYEFSPTYHAIFVKDLLDIYNLLKHVVEKDSSELLKILQEEIKQSLFWVNYLAEGDKYIPIGDVNFEGCPSKTYLNQYASELDIPSDSKIDERQYFPWLVNNELKIMLLNAPFNPSYNPAHSHCDKLSVLLWSNGFPILIDTGNFNYEKSKERDFSRSIEAHNTLQIDELQQAECWDVFRIGRRGKVTDTKVFPDEIQATYRYKKYSHNRNISKTDEGILITDNIECRGCHRYRLFFHINPDLNCILENNIAYFNKLKVVIKFPGDKVRSFKTDYYPEMYIKNLKTTIIAEGTFCEKITLETQISR